MIDNSTERRKEDGAKPRFHLNGFTQTNAIRVYAFEGRIDARRTDYTVEVDLALIPQYGIRIQDLPLLCEELLQQGTQHDEVRALILTEHQMRGHANTLAMAREESERRKKLPKHLSHSGTETGAAPFR